MPRLYTPGQLALDGEDDDRTCQNLSKRRAFSVVILANWPLAFANSCGPIEPVEKRLSRTAITVSQPTSAALHGMRRPSSRGLCINARITSMVDCDSSASAATVSSYFRCLANPNRVASLSSPLFFSRATNRLAVVKLRTLDISRFTPAETAAIALRISSKM
jgi:hypothetical protein